MESNLNHWVWIGWAVVYTLIGGILGALLIAFFAAIIPKIIARMTPRIDEEREIARGNRAVADYFSRIVAAAIIGMSIVVAAAVLGGIIAALH